MLDYQKFFEFSEECNAHYRVLLNFEMQKSKLIHEGDIERLNRSIAEEQALVMKSNSLEQKRAKLLGEENAGKTFRQIVDEAPLLYKRRLDNKYKELCGLIAKIKELNDNAAIVVNSRLKKLQNAKKHGNLDTYNVSGNVSHTNGTERHTTFNA